LHAKRRAAGGCKMLCAGAVLCFVQMRQALAWLQGVLRPCTAHNT